jgi:S1-C subfamily serine protease
VPGSVVDLILLALIGLFAVNGYRQGFLVGALSFIGFFGGALLGLQLAPLLVDHISSQLGRLTVSLLSVFGLATGGQMLAAWAGGRLREAIHSRNGRRIDDIGGVFVSVIALLLVAWMVAGPLGSSSLPSVARAVRSSVILRGIDSVMPNGMRTLYNGLRATIANGDFPNVFGDLVPTNARQVDPPDPALVGSPVVAAVHPSVAKIQGIAPSCSRQIEGSGFVYAPNHVLTNAHVVAGTQGAISVSVNGKNRAGRVVLYDPDRDLAVIYVPNLDAPALTFAPHEASTGDNAIVVGYPLNGPFTPKSARIRDVRDIRGPNIYENRTVVRQIYTIRSTVRSGNSGGPLLAQNGQVLGIIFAAAVDDPETGFALTAEEASGDAQAGQALTGSVNTGACA